MKSAILLILLLGAAVNADAADFAIVIGNGLYRYLPTNSGTFRGFPLRYAHDDARLFSTMLTGTCGFKKENVCVLFDARKADVDAALSQAERVLTSSGSQSKDRFVFFYSGHGHPWKPGLLMRDWKPGSGPSILLADLSKRLARFRVGLLWTVLDMCRQGGSEESSNFDWGSVRGSATARATFLSCRGKYSFESDELKAGQFTYYLCDAIQRQNSARDSNGRVTLSAAFRATADSMKSGSHHYEEKTTGRQKREDAVADARPTGIQGQEPDWPDRSSSASEAVLAILPKPPPTSETQWQVLVGFGLKCAKAEDFRGAMTAFAGAAEIKPGDASTLFLWGSMAERLGERKVAESKYRESIAADLHYVDARNNLGLLLSKDGRLSEAETQFRQALKDGPTSSTVAFNLGRLLDGLGRDGEAEHFYRVAIGREPRDALALSNLGLVMERARRYGDAVKLYERAIAADPAFDYPLHNLARLLNVMGRSTDAIDRYQQAIAVNPKNTRSRNNLALLLYSIGKFDEAKKLLEEARGLDPTYVQPPYNLGKILEEAHDVGGAIASYRDAVAVDPRYADAIYSLALLRQKVEVAKKDEKSRDYTEAKKGYRAVLEIDPSYIKAMNNLATLLREEGDEATAEAFYRQTIKIDPRYARGFDNVGDMLYVRRGFNEAEFFYRRATVLEPKNPVYHADLAMVLIDLCQLDEAKREAIEARRLGLKDQSHDVFRRLGI